MNILFDTNVLLDAMLCREPFGEDAAILMDAVEKNRLNGFVSGHAITTVFYLVEKSRDRDVALQTIKLLLDLFDVVPMNRHVLSEALHSPFTDYEDGVTYECARSIRADGIVTRNPRDYRQSKITIYSPRELVLAIRLDY